jgi:hypothetical protein
MTSGPIADPPPIPMQLMSAIQLAAHWAKGSQPMREMSKR